MFAIDKPRYYSYIKPCATYLGIHAITDNCRLRFTCVDKRLGRVFAIAYVTAKRTRLLGISRKRFAEVFARIRTPTGLQPSTMQHVS